MTGQEGKAQPRKVFVNVQPRPDESQRLFKPNSIRTSKYTLISFLPVTLYIQFKRFANIFFLALAIMQFFPVFATINPWVAALPFFLVIGATLVKEGMEDFRRHVSDNDINNNKCRILVNQTNTNEVFMQRKSKPKITTAKLGRVTPDPDNDWAPIVWGDLRVGDFVLLKDKDQIPADIFIVSSSETEGICFVETKNLDGETNLKIKRAPEDTCKLNTMSELHNLSCVVECEPPNANIHSFTGSLRCYALNGRTTLESGQIGSMTKPLFETPLSINNILLRGCILKNTEWAVGVVIATGDDSKIRLNAGVTPIKRSYLEGETNKLLNLICLVIICVGVTLGNYFFEVSMTQKKPSWQDLTFAPLSSYWVFSIAIFGVAVLLFQNIVPISLVITIEISYVFSDKTGTLTQNLMEFRFCSVGDGKTYGAPALDQLSGSELSKLLKDTTHSSYQKMHDLFLSVALCHSVLVQGTGDQMIFKSQSPDETALLNAAKAVGYMFFERNNAKSSISVDINGKVNVYTLLNVIEFTSDRKRMSVILRTPDNKIMLLCKGADTVIYERLAPGQEGLSETLTGDLDVFAETGLRTLCYSKAIIPEDQYKQWAEKYHQASMALENRDEALDTVAKLIEKNLTLIGATAIEDKLQDGVPEAIEKLLTAGIKVWVLTGDKTETAINIGYSCNVLPTSAVLLIIRGPTGSFDEGSTAQKIDEANRVIDQAIQDKTDEQFALIIDGNALIYCLDREKEVRDRFLELSTKCLAVMCCRVSPRQKASIVLMVKKNRPGITLAIGDGANDVSMIQAAHVGVGIAGEEGLQASLAADYAIGQFRFLARLLLVHGRWCYTRTANIPSLIYAFYSGYSGDPVFDITIFMNTLFTALPVGVLGAFNQDVKAETLMIYPALYQIGVKREAINWFLFLGPSFEAIYHATVLTFFVFYGLDNVHLSASVDVLSRVPSSVVVMLMCIWTSNIAIFINTDSISMIPVGALVFSNAMSVIYAFVWDASDPLQTGMASAIFSSISFWLLFLLIQVVCYVPRFAISYIWRMESPTDTHIAQEIDKKGLVHPGAIAPSPIGDKTSGLLKPPSRQISQYRQSISVTSTDKLTVPMRLPPQRSTLEVTDVHMKARDSFNIPDETKFLLFKMSRRKTIDGSMARQSESSDFRRRALSMGSIRDASVRDVGKRKK
ncbi:hypothetical protein EDD86DRAFT_245506 [Gorgonomyces haynaldii]|nr:hypothetical protein EDD86DRAFT_245506 [Gorgonomyces haynaldii]